mmetsp:Transcript_18237/g.44320  ORF Transcript_18237/g.44320 Transcript_18237/m.44320 type:complete len:229 (-) Transcript_18237:587-1273(-)
MRSLEFLIRSLAIDSTLMGLSPVSCVPLNIDRCPLIWPERNTTSVSLRSNPNLRVSSSASTVFHFRRTPSKSSLGASVGSSPSLFARVEGSGVKSSRQVTPYCLNSVAIPDSTGASFPSLNRSRYCCVRDPSTCTSNPSSSSSHSINSSFFSSANALTRDLGRRKLWCPTSAVFIGALAVSFFTLLFGRSATGGSRNSHSEMALPFGLLMSLSRFSLLLYADASICSE